MTLSSFCNKIGPSKSLSFYLLLILLISLLSVNHNGELIKLLGIEFSPALPESAKKVFSEEFFKTLQTVKPTEIVQQKMK